MTPKEETPSAEALPLLSEDSFQNEESRKLFEAIDELRNCGANHDIDLPEVGYDCTQKYDASGYRALTIRSAHHCRRSIRREVVPAPKLDRHSFSGVGSALYQVSNQNSFEKDTVPSRIDQSLDRTHPCELV